MVRVTGGEVHVFQATEQAFPVHWANVSVDAPADVTVATTPSQFRRFPEFRRPASPAEFVLDAQS